MARLCGEDAIVFLVSLASDTSSAHRNVRLSRPPTGPASHPASSPITLSAVPTRCSGLVNPASTSAATTAGRRRLVHSSNEGIHDEEMRNSWKQLHLSKNGYGVRLQRRTVCVSVRCTRDDDGMLCSFFFLVLIVIFVSFFCLPPTNRHSVRRATPNP